MGAAVFRRFGSMGALGWNLRKLYLEKTGTCSRLRKGASVMSREMTDMPP